MKGISYLQRAIKSSVVCWIKASCNGVILIYAQLRLVVSLRTRVHLLAWELQWLSWLLLVWQPS